MKKYPIILFFFFAVFADTVHGQFEKVLEVDNSFIGDIKFDETGSLPKHGYVAFNRYGELFAEVWVTNDGGTSWQLSSPTKFYSQLASIVIKDSFTAWIFNGQNDSVPIYKTGNGGISWMRLSLVDAFNGAYYNEKTQLLFANGGNDLSYFTKKYISNDEGLTWNISNPPQYAIKTGFAFLDSLTGIEAGGDHKTNSTLINRTTDGGLTWSPTVTIDEAWQPLAIKGTKTFFMISEIWNNVLRSDDAGLTWDTIYHFPNTFLFSGCIVGDLCHLYIQSGGEGVFESTDEGRSWHQIANIKGYRDTRFYFYNNVLFAGDVPDLSSTTRLGSLWRYKLPPNKPNILADNIFLTSNCGIAKDTTIAVAAINQCDGEKVIIDTIFTSGSTAFSLLPYSTSKEITVDSLHVHYNPVSSLAETTFVHLRFRLKGNTFDTVMTIRGSGIQPKETVGFSLAGTPTSGKAGSTVDVKISPTRRVVNKGLNEIAFDLTYNGDVLGMPKVSACCQLSIIPGAETRSGKYATLPVTIRGNDISFDSGAALAAVKLYVYLSDSTSTTIGLQNIRLNSYDPDYERCTLSATTDSTRLQVILQCPDSIIVEYMRGHSLPLRIVSLKPNPAENEVAVELDAADGGVAMMEVYDELGKRVMRKEITIAKGRQRVTISTADIAEGMYSVRMGNMSGRFVKVK